MSETISVTQGGSSLSSFLYAINDEDGNKTDISAADWEGKYEVHDRADGSLTTSGVLTKNTENTDFVFRLGAAVSELITVGEYTISIQLENLTGSVDFRNEREIKLFVRASGVANG